jgi:AAA domain
VLPYPPNVLIWLNGPFGGGKTATAYELARRLDGATVCDPEQVGFGLHRALPPPLRGDFQDLRAWRAGVVEVLGLALERGAGPVVAPMTLVNETYFDEVLGELRRAGYDVHHVALLAPREVVIERLRRRGLGRGLGRESFALDRLDGCLETLRSPAYASHLDTGHRTVAQVADEVARILGLPIAPSTDGPTRAWLRRTTTSLRHIRLD